MGKLILTASAGAILGVAIMIAMQSHVRADATPATPVAAAPTSGAAAVHVAVLEARMQRLETRAVESAPPRAAEPPPPPPLDRAAGLEEARHAFAQRLADHAAEPRDSTWAGATEYAISDTLGKLANDHQHSFEITDVDCRTTTCVARMQWANQAAAIADLRTVVQRADVPCARQITLPDGASGGPYDASLLFDCSRQAQDAAAPRGVERAGR